MRRLRDERGFTLVELLLSISILGIIMVPLGTGFFVAFRATTGTTETYAQSSDAQFVSIYFPPDVQSANQVTTSTSFCSGYPNRKVLLTSTETDGTTTTTVRTTLYWVRNNAGSYELVRTVWNGNYCSGTPQTLVVARSLTGTGAASCLSPCPDGKLVRFRVTTADYQFTVSGRMRSTT